MKLTTTSHGTYDLVEPTGLPVDAAYWAALDALVPSDNHLVVNLLDTSSFDVAPSFSDTVDRQREAGKSLILLVPEDQLDAFGEGAPVVPTLQEALDFLEMEDIERQLGF